MNLLLLFLFTSYSANAVELDQNGYVSYCPCMGRFGNQADHFLGALAFSKGVNRTLVVPPWVEYRYGEPKSMQVPYESYFNIDTLRQYHRVISMEEFMSSVASIVWPEHKRTAFCYITRAGEEENSCNAKSGNPFGPFWDTFDIEFNGSEFYGPLNYDAHNQEMMEKWKRKYSPEKWPVLAFTGAPASFPVQDGNQVLQKYVTWNNNFLTKTKSFIKQNMPNGGFLGIHLRNGQDWKRACEHVNDSPRLFAAPQCVGYRNERGHLTYSMCLPDKNEIIKQVKRALKKSNDMKYLYVASDSDHMIEDFKKALHSFQVAVVKHTPSDPHFDLAILGQANYFIGNCVSSYTAFVKRERDMKGLPSEFWAFPNRKKSKHDDL